MNYDYESFTGIITLIPIWPICL